MLREVNMGEWEDAAWGDIEYSFREMNENFEKDPDRWSIKGSETYEDVKKRMLSFITETAKHHNGKTIALFSHGFAIRSLMCQLEGIASNETSIMPYFDNTAVTYLTYKNNKLIVKTKGCTKHLDREHSTLEHQTWWRDEHRRISENLRFMQLNEVCSEDLLRIFKAKAGERAHVDKQYVAFLDDEPVGIAGIDTQRDSKLKIGWISYIHVIPKHRSKTFGTQLLGLTISEFRKLKRDRLRIILPSGNLGINFMSLYGFDARDVTDELCQMEKNIRNW
jgi:probable phosphoglycerate mutase